MDVPTVFHMGPIGITAPVVTTWAIMLVLGALSWLMTRRLQQDGLCLFGQGEHLADQAQRELPTNDRQLLQEWGLS